MLSNRGIPDIDLTTCVACCQSKLNKIESMDEAKSNSQKSPGVGIVVSKRCDGRWCCEIRFELKYDQSGQCVKDLDNLMEMMIQVRELCAKLK
jgi:hypothetical protein